MVNKSRIFTGALVGALLTIPLIAIFFLATQTVGTPFPPFDVFDFMGRILPGDIIRFGISTIVSVITTFNLGETSSAAKTAEHFLAVVGMVVTGVGVSAVLYIVLDKVESRFRYGAGMAAGLVIALPLLLIIADINRSATASPVVSAIWIVAAFALWGLALVWVSDRLSGMQAAQDEASVEMLDRRNFLVRVGGAAAVLTVVGAGVGSLRTSVESEESIALTLDGEAVEPWSATNDLPNTPAAVQPAPGTRAELTALKDHYRIDINSVPPVINEEDWTLTINGLVDNPMELTLTDIRTNYESISQFVTLACISNRVGGDLIGTTLWMGVSLKDILADAGVQTSGKWLKITAADNFDEFVSVDLINDDARVMLSYAWDGLPLEPKHGFPLRIYIPNHYGMKQPKWITTIEVVENWEEGWWVRRGWDKDAIMRATSVIDTVAVDSIITDDNNNKLVPIGGIAHAGDRGISKVEVRVDEGEWTEAQLRTPLSDTTWVLWRYDWPFAEGNYRFSVRAVEGDGTPQIERVAPTAPSGATGIHSTQEVIA